MTSHILPNDAQNTESVIDALFGTDLWTEGGRGSVSHGQNWTWWTFSREIREVPLVESPSSWCGANLRP